MIFKNTFLLTVILIVNLYSNSLSQKELQKLKSPIVTLQNNKFIIREYNSLTFDKNVLFGSKNTKKIFVETIAIMSKDNFVHKEQFIAISSSLSDQIMQSIFMNPLYFTNLKSVDLLTDKPKEIDLTIKIIVQENGIKTIAKSAKREEKNFISFKELFHQKIKP